MLSFFILALTLLISPTQAGTPRNALFGNVTYHCNPKEVFLEGMPKKALSDPRFQRYMKSYFESIVLVGLKHLYIINPALAKESVDALKTRHLTVDCKGATLSDVAETIFNPHGFGDEIHLGAITSDLLLLWEPEAITTLDPHTIEAIEESETSTYFHIPDLFHEFLHFAHLDNLSLKKHNSLYKNDEIGTKDVIYSCMAAAFPNASAKWFNQGDSLEEAKRFCANYRP